MATNKEKLTQRFSTRRIEALSDGVFAIAMTLLVLNLDVSELGDVTTNQQLWNALQGMSHQLLSFLVSFLFLGAMWAVHTRQFEYIKETDRHLIFLNTLRLLTVVTIPFTTSIASDFHQIPLAQIIFPINVFLLIAISFWQWQYATSARSGLDNSISKTALLKANRRNSIILMTSFCVIILSYFFGLASFLLFWVVALITGRPLKKYLDS